MYDTCNRVTSCLHQTQAVWRDTTDALYLLGLICILIFFWCNFWSAFLFLALYEMSYCIKIAFRDRDEWHVCVQVFQENRDISLFTIFTWQTKNEDKNVSLTLNLILSLRIGDVILIWAQMCVCTGDFSINVTESPRKWNTKPGEIVNRKPTLRSKCFSNMACIYLKHIGIRKKTDFLFPWH